MTAPWTPDSGLLSPVTPPQMFSPKPSILDRVAARLFPTGAYQGLLDSQAQQGLQRQAFQQVGTGLLQLGGRRPYQAGTLANLGAALGGAQQNFPQMADQALQLQAYRSQIGQQQAIAQVAANHPQTPGMTLADQRQRLIDMAGEMMTIPGGAPLAEKMSALIAAMKEDKPDAPQHLTGVMDTRLGSPTIGQSGDFIIPYPGAPKDAWTFVRGKPDAPKPVSGAGSALIGQEARAAAQRLGAAHLDGTVLEQHNVIPSTGAALIGGAAKLFGDRASQGVTTALRGTATNQEQQAAGRWADAYISLTPKGRGGSPALRDQIMRTYWPQEGDDPASVLAKTTARKAATAALLRAVATGTPPSLPGFEETP